MFRYRAVCFSSQGYILFQFVIQPNHFAVFSVNLKAPSTEGTFAAEVIISTQFDVSAACGNFMWMRCLIFLCGRGREVL